MVTLPTRRKRDSLIAHCLARAAVAGVGGEDAARERWGESAERLGRWEAMKVGARSMTRAGTVSAFIVTWALAVHELGEGESHAAIARWMAESPATFYRRLADFRALFPEHDDPEPIAVQLLDAIRNGADGRKVQLVPVLA